LSRQAGDAAPNPDRRDAEAWLRLVLIPGLGPAALRRLLQHFGSPAEVLAAPPAAVERLVEAPAAAALRNAAVPAAVDAALGWLDQPGHRLLTLADADYPRLLLETSDPPVLLYVAGRSELLRHGALAVVGSRSPTPRGAVDAEAFARALSDAGLTIVSGLALGIDAAGHRGGLHGASSSIAVVGTGLDRVYPARHRDLAHELAERGALVSEFPLGTPPLPPNFPRRNRILSGIARGCLVVEAALRSGSLITARLALEQGRDVFAVPGSIHSPLSKGCHWLIKQGAKLVESAQDVLEELQLPTPAGAHAQPVEAAISPEHAALLEALGYDPVDLDSLCLRANLTPDAASAMLLALELDGYLDRLPGGRYQRRR